MNGPTESNLLPVPFGISQGSVLGPTLFTLITNDLPSSVSSGSLCMYADDTTDYCIGVTAHTATARLNAVLQELHAWCIAYILHIILESLDKGGCLARLFFADFRKGFDLIDHQILLRKLAQFDLHNCLLRWVSPATSSPMVLNGGIPQGTKIGPLLFAVMVNDLVSTWSPRAKFVDDLSVVEIVPRNSPSVLNFIVQDINQYAVTNNMTLNPSKCKEMSVDFLQYNSCVLRPIVVGNAIVERVASFKLLGAYISRDLTWFTHVNYILKKANKRLYILRALRRSGVSVPDMVNIYCAVIRSVVEYASPVFSDLPAVLCCALERMQKRALSIILPGVSYQEALCQSGLAPLEVRRAESCVNFMKSVKSGNPLLPICEGLLVNNESKYNLRHQLQHKVIVNTNRFKDFVTFRYAHSIVN